LRRCGRSDYSLYPVPYNLPYIISRARGHELFNAVECLNAAPGSGCHAIQSGGGAGEIELALKRPVLKQSIDESSVKNISRAGGVNDRNTVGSGVVKLLAIPCQHAVLP
jgi:hypothetical protein